MMKTLTFAVCALCAATMTMSSAIAEESQEKWVSLFDGKTTEGWRNYNSETIRPQWKVVDGTLTLAERGGGDIITDKTYENFEFKMDWKVPTGEKINSGIFFGVNESKRPIWEDAFETQIFGNEAAPNLPDLFIAGSVFGLYPSKREWSKPSGEWNTTRVLKKDGKVQVYFNENLVANFDLNSPEFKEKVSNTKFKQWPGFATFPKGNIGIQDHGNTVGLTLRNIMIREL